MIPGVSLPISSFVPHVKAKNRGAGNHRIKITPENIRATVGKQTHKKYGQVERTVSL
jgi:hypothetical protein